MLISLRKCTFFIYVESGFVRVSPQREAKLALLGKVLSSETLF